MRRAFGFLTVSVFSLLVATGGPAYADYCAANASSCAWERISRVQVGSIDSATGCSTGGYGDYTAQSTAVLAGASYPITITNGDGYASDQCAVWVDWNQDGDFFDGDELIVMSGSPGPGPYSGLIVPPVSALVGATRMRVRIAYNATPEPCGSTTYGEVEDYTLIVAGSPEGACCNGVVCTPNTLPGDCAAGGGTFLGPGSTCDPNPCSGACCVALECVGTTTEANCAAQSGTWYVGEDCATFECPQSYCEAGSGAQDEYISRVQLGSIDKSSGASPGGYEDYSSLSTELAFGVPYQLTVTNGNPYLSDRCGSWVDWNNDGDFYDAGETLVMVPGTGYGPYIATVSIPAGTPAGQKRLRIRISYSSDPVPCGIMNYGEVEDYAVLVPELPLTGACCQGQTCMPDMSEADCLTAGGVYRGGGSTCDPNPCSGACCVSEACVATTSEPECTTLGGTWYAGEVCGSFTCPGPNYCIVSSEADPYIQRVQIHTIDNTTTYFSGGYQNFTSISMDADVGADYPITVTASSDYMQNRCAVWVDWNRDGDFADAGEHYALTAGAAPHTGTITVPVGTPPGTKRLRVRVTYGEEDPEPCGSAAYGEAEDYTVVVLPPAPYGACCQGQSCTPDLSAADCATLGGTYLGDGSDCDPNPCSGACCVNEVCVANTTEADCVALSGTWHLGEDCATFSCPGPDYCEAFGGIANPYISRVQLNTIDNPSTYAGGWREYQDFTAIATVLEVGMAYPLVVTSGVGYSNNYCTAWVDWNRDGDFDDPGEEYTLSSGVGPHVGIIAPPVGTSPGNKRLRIVMLWAYVPQPCGEQPGGYGEVEDYTIISVTSPGACCLPVSPWCQVMLPEDCIAAGGYFQGGSSTCTSPDCNNNGILDACDIASGFSQDCNSNGVPDECDIADSTSSDCNENGIPDECDIASGFSEDCNGNGIPDECDIADSTSFDCNENGIPDECDIASGFSEDCNGNGIPDECDIASGFSEDCQSDGIPDECQLNTSFMYQYDDGVTEDVLGWTNGGELCWLQYFTTQVGAEAIDSVLASFGRANYPGVSGVVPGQTVRVFLWSDPTGDGDPTDAVFVREVQATIQASAIDTDVPQSIAISPAVCIQPPDFPNASFFVGVSVVHVAGRFPAPLDLSVSSPGGTWLCGVPGGSFNPHILTNLYEMGSAGLPGVWLLRANGTTCGAPANDCNENGIPDECDIASGTSQDANSNGVPDECEAPPVCRGDCNCDGAVGFTDIDLFVAGIPNNQANWAAKYLLYYGQQPPAGCWDNCDVNGVGTHCGFDDIDWFVKLIPTPCTARACCFPDHTCQDLVPGQCLIAGGTFSKTSSDLCAQTTCP